MNVLFLTRKINNSDEAQAFPGAHNAYQDTSL